MDRPLYFPMVTRLYLTSRTKVLRTFTQALLALIPLLFVPIGMAGGQTGTISGVVLDRNQAPLPNAQVTVRGTQLGTQTDANGRFRLAGIDGSSAVLDIRRLGYKATSS
jgi:hypothetical protein